MNVSLGEKLKWYRDLVFGFHGGLQQMSNGSHDRWNRGTEIWEGMRFVLAV